jgi:hypothetical protein
MLRSLLAPGKPGEEPMNESVDALRAHFYPKPSVIVQQFRFHSRTPQEGESIAAELQRLAEDCAFGPVLQNMLRS